MTKKAKKWLRFRVATVAIIFLVLFVGLVSRALQLQVISGKTLKALAERQHTRNLVLYPERKMIFGPSRAKAGSHDSVRFDLRRSFKDRKSSERGTVDWRQ